MKKFVACIFLLFPLVSGFSQTYTLETVPNPKSGGKGYVSNPDEVISQTAVYQINTQLADLEKATTIQVAVVVLNSIGDEVPGDFATELFNKWGIGVKGKDNGLLILMVYDQHRVEFRTGYGMESLLPDVTCKRIQLNYMVPKFKESNYDDGMLDGIKATIDVLRNPETSAIMAQMDERENNLVKDDPFRLGFTAVIAGLFFIVGIIAFFIEKKDGKFSKSREAILADHKVYLPISMAYWLTLYMILPITMIGVIFFIMGGKSYYGILILAIYGYLMFLLIENRIRSNSFLSKATPENDYFTRYQLFSKANKNWFWAAIFFPLPFLFYFIFYKIRISSLRNHPRPCNLCQQPMVRLDEKADDAYLEKSQLLEEGLESIDYDVWKCTSCDNHQVLRFESAFSKYDNCTSCGVKSYYLDKDITLVSATYSHSGTGKKSYLCKNCNHHEVKSYTIARLERSSSGSGSGSGSSSFGGGSSGGGGSGSSW